MKDKTSPTNNPDVATNGEPATGSPSASKPAPSRRPTARARREKRPRTLLESRGPDPGTPLEAVRLTVGRLGGAHGLQGHLKMRILTDEPDHLASIKMVYLGERDTPITLEQIRFTNDGALVKLAGTDTPEDAALLSGLPVKIAGTDARPLEEGEYFLYQLIGLSVFDESGEELGVVTDLMETGAHDVLVVGKRPNGADDMLVPNHPEFVLEVSPDANRLVMRPPEYPE